MNSVISVTQLAEVQHRGGHPLKRGLKTENTHEKTIKGGECLCRLLTRVRDIYVAGLPACRRLGERCKVFVGQNGNETKPQTSRWGLSYKLDGYLHYQMQTGFRRNVQKSQ